MWEIEYTDEFGQWFAELSEEHQEAVADRVRLLQEHGPSLQRPVVGSVIGSRHHNLKELVVTKTGAIRVLFMFDERRVGILLMGGSKVGLWKQWYVTAVPAADALYDVYLEEVRREKEKE